VRRLWDLLFRRRGAGYWRVFIWATAVTALACIPIVTAFPDSVPLVWLWLVGIPANSPIAPLFPTAFEPLVVEAAKYQPALTVTLVATASFVYMEFINWYVFAWVLSWEKLEGLKSHRWVRWGIRHFSHAPYLTVFAFAVTPIPFWIARSLAILYRLSFWRYMVAMAIGRFPRLYIYAWLGSRIKIPTPVLIGTAVGTGIILIAWRLLRKEPLLKDSVLDG
jgi:uncharacterized membrane protein YdjX (TVP38/TMEM64 family)